MNNSEAVFESWRSYRDFQREVSQSWRYVRTDAAGRFLAALVAGAKARTVELPSGRAFFRAQIAHGADWDPEIGDAFPAPAPPSRMYPLPDRATEGRVNPKGIPCLYMASDQHTALAEVRPWIGSLVSIGRFRLERPVTVVNCADGADALAFYWHGEPPPEKREEAVWGDIARAFREPVRRDDDVAEYAATQVVAEVLRNEGFDGVVYGSAFGASQYTIALFDTGAAALQMNSLHRVDGVKFQHDEIANPYFARKNSDGETKLVRNVIIGFEPVAGSTAPATKPSDRDSEIK